MNKLFDLRFVIGSFFSIIGIILLAYGLLASGSSEGAHTINKFCGAVFIVFGIIMILLSLRKDAHDELLKET